MIEDPRKEPEYRDKDSAEDIVEAYLIEAGVMGLCALADVVAERKRQIEVEGYTPENDDLYVYNHLAMAAACYAAYEVMDTRSAKMGPGQTVDVPKYWPWSFLHWKPKGRRRNLIRAAALILAEIERLDRAEHRKGRLAALDGEAQ